MSQQRIELRKVLHGEQVVLAAHGQAIRPDEIQHCLKIAQDRARLRSLGQMVLKYLYLGLGHGYASYTRLPLRTRTQRGIYADAIAIA